MDGSFACPECGGEIRLRGLSPGRLVRCGWCRTRVETPFLPRADPIQALRRARQSSRRRRWPLWAKGLAVFLTLAIALAGARRAARSHFQKAETASLARLVESSREAESSGRLGEALSAIEGAVAYAGSLAPPPADLDDLRRRRDLLARREAESQLAALSAAGDRGDPGRAVGRALTLLTRARKDPALDGLETAAREALERLRLRWAEADADAARSAFNARRPGEALELCQRLYSTAHDLSATPRRFWEARATDLARRVIARHGTILDAVRGEFTLGSPAAYAALLHPPLSASLRTDGYLPRPPGDVFDDLWSTLAPYRLGIEVKERLDDNYFQSENRLSLIRLTVTLNRNGETLWSERPVGQTQVPLPGLPAYQASRNSVGPRSSTFEKLLYENARANLLQRLSPSHLRFPACPPADSRPPV